LAPIWLQIRQQTDKAGKKLVLRTFFQDLGKQVAAFKQFRNSTLFDNIVAFKFEPGHSYETCHHGLSILSVSMRSFADQEKERQDDDWFDTATNKTPEAVRKHNSKLPPPLPATVAKLLQLLLRLIALMVGLFTIHCSLAIQLEALYQEVQEREQHLLGDPVAASALLPQLTWAVISATREFFGTICTRDDVDPSGSSRMRLAIANLSIHTSMLKAGYNLDLANVPAQWKHKPSNKPTPRQSSNTGGEKSGGQNQKDKRYGADPFQQQNNTGNNDGGRGDNPHFAKAFATGLQQIKDRFAGVTLSDIVQESGIRGGPLGLNTTGLPPKSCLNWVCMGHCRHCTCQFQHPDHIEEAIAETIFKQMEPGVRRILEAGKRPKLNCK
jgi:hypothetical protein